MTESSRAYQDLTARLMTWATAHRMNAYAARLRLAHERLLARMDAAAPLRWMVRGGRAIDLRFDGRARQTGDLDVSLTDAPQMSLTKARQVLIEVCQKDLGDEWNITLDRLEGSLAEGVGVVGFKAWLTTTYHTQFFEQFSLDVSKANSTTIAPEVLRVPVMLANACMRIVVVRPEVQIAEKVHAFTRPYGAARPRARSYDLVDAVALALAGEIDLAMLRAAAEETFRTRDTHPLPGTLAAAPVEWATAFQLHGEGYGLAHLSTAQGFAKLSALWERAMRPFAEAHEVA